MYRTKRQNQSVEVLKNTKNNFNEEDEQREIFQKLEENIQKGLNEEEKKKALARLELLKKYLNSKDIDLIDLVKKKMTKELMENKGVPKSTVYQKLSNGLKVSLMSHTFRFLKMFPMFILT